jgi:GTP-binding protein
MNKVEFIASYAKAKDCPDSDLAEFCFIGRSNVGKSSMINFLTSRKAIAKVSGQPGKTQLVNFFLMNDSWHLVDLPGYGYAKTSKTSRKYFSKLIMDYLSIREKLQCAFLLIDINIPPQELDLKMMHYCGLQAIPIAFVFTKCDKLSKIKLNSQIEIHKRAWLDIWEELPKYFTTSTKNGEGREEILNYIQSINALYNASK